MSAAVKAPLERLPVAAAILLGLTALIYWPVASFEFLNWDDPWYVLNNPFVQSWAPSNLLAIVTEPNTKNYAPLTTFTLLIEHTLFGTWAGGYHLVNVLLHAANAVLVLELVRRVTGSRWIGWFTAILFTVHPIQIESVAWISSLKSLLAALFMLASLMCWLKPERTNRDEGFGLLWLVLALLSKTSAVVVPAIVLVWDVVVSRRRVSEALPRQIIPGLFCLIALFLNMSAQNQMWGGSREHFDWGLGKILLMDSVILWRYLRMLVAPYDLSVMYDVTGEGIGVAAAIAIAAWLAVAAVVWKVRKTQPLVVWSIASAFLLMFPVLNVFPITTLMNDRYLYLPCILVFAGAGALIQVIAGKIAWSAESRDAIARGGKEAAAAFRRRQWVGTAVAASLAVLVGYYSSVSQKYLGAWRNPVTLWTHALAQTPELPVVQIQWALTLHDHGRTGSARQLLEAVLRGERADEGDRTRIVRILEEWRRLDDLAGAQETRRI